MQRQRDWVRERTTTYNLRHTEMWIEYSNSLYLFTHLSVTLQMDSRSHKYTHTNIKCEFFGVLSIFLFRTKENMLISKESESTLLTANRRHKHQIKNQHHQIKTTSKSILIIIITWECIYQADSKNKRILSTQHFPHQKFSELNKKYDFVFPPKCTYKIILHTFVNREINKFTWNVTVVILTNHVHLITINDTVTMNCHKSFE